VRKNEAGTPGAVAGRPSLEDGYVWLMMDRDAGVETPALSSPPPTH
jgi:hypothetical protein